MEAVRRLVPLMPCRFGHATMTSVKSWVTGGYGVSGLSVMSTAEADSRVEVENVSVRQVVMVSRTNRQLATLMFATPMSSLPSKLHRMHRNSEKKF